MWKTQSPKFVGKYRKTPDILDVNGTVIKNFLAIL